MPVTFLTNEDEKKYVKTINDTAPDENGNIVVKGEGIAYDNTASGIDATTVQGAIDKLSGGNADQEQITTAINTALAQAKASGEFDGKDGKDGSNGKDGVSATHSWNGTTLTITSASGTSSADLKGEKGDTGEKGETGAQGIQGVQGIQGEQGAKGDTGAAGADGVSVSSVKQTTTSSADGGSNVVTVTLSDGTTSTFTVKNGSKGSTGSKGDKGDKGDTGPKPVKGVDYWTSADKAVIIQDVIDAIGGTPVFGVVDSSNNIVLTGNLAEGTYTLKYEDADGNVTEIGTLKQSSVTYTNLFDPATATLNKRMSASSNAPKDQAGYVITALIPIPATAVTSSSRSAFIAVPKSMWSGSANIYLAMGNATTQGMNDNVNTTYETVGNWAKIPLLNQWGNNFTCDGVMLSLNVKDSTISTSDIQNIEIYFNEIPE